MSLSARFEGRVERLVDVEVASLASWIAEVEMRDWPQQRTDELRPAMISDLGWRGFGTRVAPVVERVVALFAPGARVDTFQLSAVLPGHSIPPHLDEQPESWLARVHVPLLTNAESFFVVEDERFAMPIGAAYRVNTLRRHAVENRGTTPRVHFMFDVKRGTR